MFKVENITDGAKQKQTLLLPDGTIIALSIEFDEQQQGWFISSLVYKTFALEGLRITNSPNMLHQFKNRVPFGLACFSAQDREPSLIKDFLSASSILYILTAAETAEYGAFLSGQV